MSLYKRKDSSVYWVKLSHGGKIVQRSTGTADKVKAREYHDKLKATMWDQERLGVRPRYSWQQAAGRWIEETSHKATHKEDIAKLKWLHSLLGELMLDEITLDMIARIKEARLKLASKTTTNRFLALVRSILKRAVDEWDWLDKAPKVKLFKEAEGRERSLTPLEANRLLSELPPHLSDMALFTLHTGLRQSNVLKLEWSCVDLSRCHAWVSSINSKNRKPISVNLNAQAMEVLNRQIGKHPARVFTCKGKPISQVVNTTWKNSLVGAGIQDLRWHDLRHTWATWLRQLGTPTYELQRMGGWKTAAMVERYAHVAPDHLAQSAARLDTIGVGYDLATVNRTKIEKL
ncbi:MAG: tyrosine-type recombinase/integrase [Gallionella sp.]|jgi:integrase|nr:tyrosine-type recombinase/integrase [Gallionella sp.]